MKTTFALAVALLAGTANAKITQIPVGTKIWPTTNYCSKAIEFDNSLESDSFPNECVGIQVSPMEDSQQYVGYGFETPTLGGQSDCCATSALHFKAIDGENDYTFKNRNLPDSGDGGDFTFNPDCSFGKFGYAAVSIRMEPGRQKFCCEDCKCYGDPHCVGFLTNQIETWVTCDTRMPLSKQDIIANRDESNVDKTYGQCFGTNSDWKSKRLPTYDGSSSKVTSHKQECGQIEGKTPIFHRSNNADMCVYHPESSWDFRYEGSRCQLNPDYEARMNMYTSPDGRVTLDLIMADRGVIGSVYLSIDDQEYLLESKFDLPDSLHDTKFPNIEAARSCGHWVKTKGTGVGTKYSLGSDAKDAGYFVFRNELIGQNLDAEDQTTVADVWWTVYMDGEGENFMGGEDKAFFDIQCMGYENTRIGIDHRINVEVKTLHTVNGNVRPGHDTGFCDVKKIVEVESLPSEYDYEAAYCVNEGRPEAPEVYEHCRAQLEEYCPRSKENKLGDKFWNPVAGNENGFRKWWQNDREYAMAFFTKCTLAWCQQRYIERPGISNDQNSIQDMVTCMNDVQDFKFMGANKLYPLKSTTCEPFNLNELKVSQSEGEDCKEGIQVRLKDENGDFQDHLFIPRSNYCEEDLEDGFINFNVEKPNGLVDSGTNDDFQIKLEHRMCEDPFDRCTSIGSITGTVKFLESPNCQCKANGSGPDMTFDAMCQDYTGSVYEVKNVCGL